MQKLIEGIHQFQTDVVGSRREFFANLADGQRPQALFITCSDSRVNPNLLTQTEPGELFIIRNAGNIVPPHGVPSGEAATIEYAIAVLGITDIIVCGHTHCGAMAALLARGSVDRLPAVRSWLAFADATARIVEDNYATHDEAARLTIAIEENVLVQLEHVRTMPAVASARSKRGVRLHGWVYNIETGDVFSYAVESGQFERIGAEPAGRPSLPPPRMI